jgi:uncharacterized membrane protein YccC
LGTAFATWLAGLLDPGDPIAIVAILGLIAVALWLRTLSYAWWSAAVTAALALLLGYYGQSDAGVLVTRLEAIVVGGLLGLGAAWFVLPIRTIDVLRKRLAETRTALVALTTADAPLDEHASRLQNAVGQLDQIAAPLETRRRLARWLRRPGPHHADVIDTARTAVVHLPGAMTSSPAALARLDEAAKDLGLFLRRTRPPVRQP